jgi:phosphoribosylformylglycinamidine synthase
VLATVVGEVSGTGRLVVEWRGEIVVDVPPASLAEEGPVYDRPYARPSWLDERQAQSATALPRPTDLRTEILRLIASPNLASPRWVTEQYDRYVLSNTVLAMPEDAGLVRLGDGPLGVALSLDGPGRFAALDPYAGAQLALAEAARNVAVSGAVPVAVTNCLNFGSPEDPDVMWQFSEAVRGLADGCRALEIPVTGGNVSFYNQTGQTPINPTPVIGVLGIIDDVATRTPIGFGVAGDVVVLLGETRDELSGSEWAWSKHSHLGGLPPVVDLAAERALHRVLTDPARKLRSAHDCGGGGLAATLVESCLRSGIGAQIALPPGDLFVQLFSESAGRVVVSLPSADVEAFLELAAAQAIPAVRIGVVGGLELDIDGVGSIELEELRVAHERTLPAYFG